MSNWKMMAACLAFAASSLFAHHPFASEYDQNKPLTLSGKISKVEWSDPHVQIHMMVKDQNGKEEAWTVEAAKPDYLKAHGAPMSAFKKGETVSVNAYAATKETRKASGRMVTMPDGKSVQICDPQEDGGPTK